MISLSELKFAEQFATSNVLTSPFLSERLPFGRQTKYHNLLTIPIKGRIVNRCRMCKNVIACKFANYFALLVSVFFCTLFPRGRNGRVRSPHPLTGQSKVNKVLILVRLLFLFCELYNGIYFCSF